MSLHVHGQQLGQQIHVTIRADDFPGLVAEFDTSVDAFARFVDALNMRASVTHGDPEPAARCGICRDPDGCPNGCIRGK